MSKTAFVTGAFSYTGSAVAKSLVARGYAVRTLTNRTTPVNDPGIPIQAHPLEFENAARIEEAMRGAQVFVNTYWVRYPYVGVTFDQAVANSRLLFDAALKAGVERIVQVSVSNASLDSPLAYYRGKAQVEEALKGLGVSYAIVRPTLIVGPRDILAGNIAGFLRRFPLFALPGSGRYRLQPITLEDAGEIIAEAALGEEDMTIDAAGPEILTFRDLVEAIAQAIGRRPPLVSVPPGLALALLRVVGWAVGEVILSKEELEGLMSELLLSGEPPRGRQSVREWLRDHGAELGRSYVSEINRHVRAA